MSAGSNSGVINELAGRQHAYNIRKIAEEIYIGRLLSARTFRWKTGFSRPNGYHKIPETPIRSLKLAALLKLKKMLGKNYFVTYYQENIKDPTDEAIIVSLRNQLLNGRAACE